MVRPEQPADLRPGSLALTKRARSGWDAIFEAGEMRCSRCERVKPISEYREVYDRPYRYLTSHCKLCDSKRCAIVKSRKASTVEGSLSYVWTNIKRRSREREEVPDFDLSFLVELWINQKGLCYYTGLPMQLSTDRKASRPGGGYKKNGRLVVSADRLNPDVGYFKNNVVLCTWVANNVKQDLAEEHLKEVVRLIYENYAKE